MANDNLKSAAIRSGGVVKTKRESEERELAMISSGILRDDYGLDPEAPRHGAVYSLPIPKRKALFLNLISAGFKIRQIAKELVIPRRQFYRWATEDKEFGEKVRASLQAAAISRAPEAMEYITDIVTGVVAGKSYGLRRRAAMDLLRMSGVMQEEKQPSVHLSAENMQIVNHFQGLSDGEFRTELARLASIDASKLQIGDGGVDAGASAPPATEPDRMVRPAEGGA